MTKVRALEQVVQTDQLDVEELGSLDRDNGVVRHHLHLDAVRTLGHLGPDVAHADDTERLAPNLGADELRASPFAAFDRSVCLRNPPRERNSNAMVCSAAATMLPARGIDHEDALARGRGDVDVVNADARTSDHTQLAPASRGSAP